MRLRTHSAQMVFGLAVFCWASISASAQQADEPRQQQSTQAQNEKSQPKDKDKHVFVLGDAPASAGTATGPDAPARVTNVPLSNEKLNKENRLDLIRALNAEIAFARKPLPRMDKGLILPANGRLEPDEGMLNQLVLEHGPAARKGEKVQITDLQFRDKEILFQLNGGPRTKHKWYEHVSIGSSGGQVAPMARPDDPKAKGTILALTFPKYVPQISAAEVRELLSPVLDFSIKSPLQAYADTLPPGIRAAVLAHKALVGMTHEMVLASLGRPDKKFRDDETGEGYEDWMYGKPPATVQFMRFKGDQLVRIKELPVGESAVIRDKPEIEASELGAVQQGKDEAVERVKEAKAEANRPKPTLRRSDDPTPPQNTSSDTVTVSGKSTTGNTPTTPGDTGPGNTGSGNTNPTQYPGQQQTRPPVGQIPGVPTAAPLPGTPGDGSSGPR